MAHWYFVLCCHVQAVTVHDYLCWTPLCFALYIRERVFHLAYRKILQVLLILLSGLVAILPLFPCTYSVKYLSEDESILAPVTMVYIYEPQVCSFFFCYFIWNSTYCNFWKNIFFFFLPVRWKFALYSNDLPGVSVALHVQNSWSWLYLPLGVCLYHALSIHYSCELREHNWTLCEHFLYCIL